MPTLLQDLRYALRQLRRAPGFALTAILTLALGIGSATAVFSVVDAVLLRPLPFAHQERLVVLNTLASAGYNQPWSYLSYLDARDQLKTLDAFAGYTPLFKSNLESPSGPVSLTSIRGTANFFDVFGVQPRLGRTFLPGEDQPGHTDVAVLSYEVWETDFGGQPDTIGKVVRLDGVPHTVIGVMPAGFRFPLSARNAVYTPLDPTPQWKANRGSHWMQTVGLLKPGVTRQQAQADLARGLSDLGRAFPETDAGRTAKLVSLHTAISGDTSGPLQTLLFAVFALLAIACVNVAGLLLARGIKREREMALRAAIGAGRARLLRQVLTESLVLSASGLALGLLLSAFLLAAMRTFLIDAVARGSDVHLNLTVLFAASVLAVLTGVVASLAPALRLSGADPNRALRSGGAAGVGRSQHRLRSGFVITQVALSLVLLVVAGLLLRNLRSLLQTPLGFDPARVLTVALQLSPGEYDHRDPLSTFYTPLLDRITHLPGVEAAGVVNLIPIRDWGSNGDVHIAGQPPHPRNQEMLAEMRFVSAGYFDAMGIKLLRGRTLSAAEDTPDLKVSNVVFNQAFQKKFFAQGNHPVGARTDEGTPTNLVGLVTDVRQNLYQPPLAEMDYLIDEIDLKDRLALLSAMTLVVRSQIDPATLAPALRNAIHAVDPSVPFHTPETMTDVISESLVFERLENWLFGLFAAFALLLAFIGLSGLISHEVELRTRDIGIRMALGSTRARVVAEILRRVALLMASGLAAGWLLTLASERATRSVVEFHAANDALLLLSLTVTVFVVGVAASLLPARRAASINPTEALRSE